MKYKVLVFPCGSEIGLELHRSLKYSTHVEMYGASSMNDHGMFVFENYIPNVPFFTEDNFIQEMQRIVETYEIDAIYPTMDAVIKKLTDNQDEFECKIISSPQKTTSICSSKSKTYEVLKDSVTVPKIYLSQEEIDGFPVFVKPDVGYGSRGAKKVDSQEQLYEHLKEYENCIISEYLPGVEYTVDCFTDRNGELLFSGARQRIRTMNGISVNTKPVEEGVSDFEIIAKRINNKIEFRGAWFFQLKRNVDGELALLEIASRLGGSSSVHRNKGVNFALLSIFDAFDKDVSVFYNNYSIELDRALTNRYKIDISFEKAYIDFDDCLILNDREVNTDMIRLIYQFVNRGVDLVLLTKHDKDIRKSLKEYRLEGVFDEIIHISKEELKSKYIESKNAIFIDDSFAERSDVYKNCKIPVFAPNNIEALLKD